MKADKATVDHLVRFFALSNQAEWTRRQIVERIEKEVERLNGEKKIPVKAIQTLSEGDNQ